jgi:hypothetical protein
MQLILYLHECILTSFRDGIKTKAMPTAVNYAPHQEEENERILYCAALYPLFVWLETS